MARNVDIINQQGTEFGPPFFVFVGHSLGGAAAQCLCGRVANSRSISLNVSFRITKQGGAACTNPVLVSFCKKLYPEPRSGEDVLAAPNDDEFTRRSSANKTGRTWSG